ncbi:MAG: serine/threonine protein kinase, partial [Microbacterium sp.]
SQVAIAMAQINEQAPPLPPTVAVPVQNLVMAMIAKKPEERPASSAAVARAATALRRGDVAAAAAAVPAIATGAAGGDDMTQLLTSAGATAAATQLLPAGEDVVQEEPEKKKRSPWTWPLIALIVLLLLVLGGTIWAFLANQQPAPDPTTSSTAPSPSASTPTPTPTVSTISVDSLGLSGMDCTAASETARAAGIEAVDCVGGDAAPSAEQVNTVYRVSPTGNIPPSQLLTLTFYVDQVAMPAPAAPTMAATVEAGTSTQVGWGGYTCPSGTGSVSSYNFSATNATFVATGQSTASFGPNDRTGELLADNNAGATVIVTYTVTCSGGTAGQRDSGPSGEATSAIEAPVAPTPTPTP